MIAGEKKSGSIELGAWKEGTATVARIQVDMQPQLICYQCITIVIIIITIAIIITIIIVIIVITIVITIFEVDLHLNCSRSLLVQF